MVKRTTKRTRTRKLVAPKLTTALDVIRQLRVAFHALDDDTERGKLWDVLTALRGCDLDANDKLKYATTAIIRTRVFGRDVQDTLGFHRAMFQDTDSAEFAAIRTMPYEEVHGTYHFKQHVTWAFDVLGLSMANDNGEIQPV